MPKHSKTDKEATNKKTIRIINRMRCPWIVPRELISGESMADLADMHKRIAIVANRVTHAMPNEMVSVDKEGFEKYYKLSKAFQAQIDQKYLEIVGKRTPKEYATEALKSINEAKVPKHLQSDGHGKTATTFGKREEISIPHAEKMKTVSPISI